MLFAFINSSEKGKHIKCRGNEFCISINSCRLCSMNYMQTLGECIKHFSSFYFGCVQLQINGYNNTNKLAIMLFNTSKSSDEIPLPN